jgi:gliding motility-associated lipoprotein GldD
MRSISILAAFGFIMLLTACKPERYTPRPRGYARMDTPQHAYRLFDTAGFPSAFEYPVYGRIVRDTGAGGVKPDNPYWINIEFPEWGSTIYLSYKTIDAQHSLDKLLQDTHEMTAWHTKVADYINTPAFHNPHGVHGIFYSVGGNAASAYQFFATDSTQHFLRGALYFNATPNADSLRPLTEFFRRDMEHLIGTLRWK